MKFFSKLTDCLVKTSKNLGLGFITLLKKKTIDNSFFQELEDKLIISDVGVTTSNKIINNLRDYVHNHRLTNVDDIYQQLKKEISEILIKVEKPLLFNNIIPFIIFIVGVNGSGKTTTIGKLAYKYKKNGKKVMLAAGDTFRAAAIEQLKYWGIYNNIPVISKKIGSDAASVIFNSINAAIDKKIDILIIDTAGRMQNKNFLMEELKKIIRVIKKIYIEAPHEVMLIIDANSGQNIINQTYLFNKSIKLTGITVTKLDGSAKGGVIINIADSFNIPIRYVSMGENINDLEQFKVDNFIKALLI